MEGDPLAIRRRGAASQTNLFQAFEEGEYIISVATGRRRYGRGFVPECHQRHQEGSNGRNGINQ